MKVYYKFDIEPFGQNEMVQKLSYKYDIEKQETSLSQAKCPISLTALFFQKISKLSFVTFLLQQYTA